MLKPINKYLNKVGIMKYIIILFFLTFHQYTLACSGSDKTLEYKVNNANKVFRGKILSIKKVDFSHPDFVVTHEVTVLTGEVFKGQVKLIEKIYTSDSSGTCGFGFNENDKVFFVDSYSYSGMLFGTFQLTPQISQDGDVKYIRGEKELFKLRHLKRKSK